MPQARSPALIHTWNLRATGLTSTPGSSPIVAINSPTVSLGTTLQIDERVILVKDPGDSATLIRPDVAIERRESWGGPGPVGLPAGAAVLEPVTIPNMIIEEVRQTRVEILHHPDRSLVTVLEILSPTNKVEPGYSFYEHNRTKLLFSGPVHLVELDLLVRGRRVRFQRPLPAGHHYALISRSDRYPDCDIYAWTIRQPLPTIPIPLRAPDPDVWLDLPALVAQAYDRGRYARLIDYKTPLDLPLSDDDRAWAESRAQEAVG